MKKAIAYILFGFAFTLFGIAQTSITVDNGFISNQLYVKIIPPTPQDAAVQYIPHPDNPQVGRSAWDIVKKHKGLSMVKAFNTEYHELKTVYKITLSNNTNIDELIAELSNSADVDYVERIPVYQIDAKPIDLDEGKQWYFKNINMDASWTSISRNPNQTKIIAVIDNGVLYEHEDLRQNIALNFKEIPNDGLDNDGNGYVDDFFGWNVADSNSNVKPHDIDPILRNDPRLQKFGWHGTHVAGIIGAGIDNNVGIASLGLNNAVLPIKAAGFINNKPNDVILTKINEAFRYAIERKVHIINCSFTSPSKSIVTQSIINEAVSKGIIVIASAGNYKNDLPHYPAAYDGVIAVGATDQNDKVWESGVFGSNTGSYIDVMAPGNDIYSTASTASNSYGYLSGTSMAAPIVSGLAGLILSMEPDRGHQIEKIIKEGCDNIDAKNPNFIGKMGAGRINVDKSFNYLISIGSTFSVVETPYNKGFSVYPNPAQNQFFIPFDDISTTGKPVSITIHNAVGAEVLKVEVSQQNQALQVANLSNGIYQIVATNSEGENFTSRLVVKH